MGEPFTTRIVVESAAANVVVFRSNGVRIFAQLQDDGTLLLRKEGAAFPVLLRRAGDGVYDASGAR